MDTPRIVALYGSPRRRGNTATLEIVLRDLKMSACLEIYSCKQDGECRIRDDFQRVRDQVIACDGLMLASPIFYYAVSAHTKILMVSSPPAPRAAGGCSTARCSACGTSSIPWTWISGRRCFTAGSNTRARSMRTPTI